MNASSSDAVWGESSCRTTPQCLPATSPMATSSTPRTRERAVVFERDDRTLAPSASRSWAACGERTRTD